METQTRNKMKQMKVIYNSDMAVLDLLADLTDRKVVRDLQTFIDDSQGKPGILLHNCKDDDMVVLILYKSPFGFNDEGNNLILYADVCLRNLIKYFKKSLDNTPEDCGELYRALDDIIRHLYFTWANEQDNNTPLHKMG